MKTAHKTKIQNSENTHEPEASVEDDAVTRDPRVVENGDTITRISTSRGELVILGTAHVSEDSAREVDQTIRDENPEAVCIELDQNRYKSLNQENSWKNLDIFQIIRQKKTFLLLSNLVLSAYQKRLGLNLGTKPGDEMRAAVAAADELGITKFMIDRDIQMTLSRAWRKTGFWGKNKILAVLIGSAFSREELDEDAIESLKQRSALDDMMKEMAEFLPSVKQVLIDERDHYLAINSWKKMNGREKVLSVVGAGHVPGMVRKILELDDLEKQENTSSGESSEAELKEISKVPPRGIISKSLPWLLVAAIAGLIISGFITKGWEGGFRVSFAGFL
ncbi:TraB/GumN family protein [Salinispira pacifica]|uniref:TraB/GumN family protein n=1 Tax=Salinispira pacifica TaxID=1307761 RepID=UPI0004105539|nr:TraB/GumN family protein [Salinispira pacifica]